MHSRLHCEPIIKAFFVILFLQLACAPPRTTEVSGTGTIIIDAVVSNGTRFVVYCNDVWSNPERQGLTVGQRSKYTFPVPNSLRTLRFDPSEAPDSHATIYSVELDCSPLKVATHPIHRSFNELWSQKTDAPMVTFNNHV